MFIKPGGSPLTVKDLMNVQTWKQMIGVVQKHKGITSLKYYVVDNKTLYKRDGEDTKKFSKETFESIDMTVIPAAKEHMIAYKQDNTTVCVLFLNDAKPKQCYSFPTTTTAINIIHWNESGDELFIAGRQKKWELFSIDVQTQTKKMLVGDIEYNKNVLTRSYEPLHSYILYPVCPTGKKCRIEMYNILSNRVSGSVSAIVDESEGETLSELDFSFFSELKHMIAYSNVNAEGIPFRFLTIKHNEMGNDTNPLLMQSVRLDINKGRWLSFEHYYSTNGMMLFSGVNTQTGKKELYAYSIDKPSLTVLDTINQDVKLTPINREDAYGLDKDVGSIVTKTRKHIDSYTLLRSR